MYGRESAPHARLASPHARLASPQPRGALPPLVRFSSTRTNGVHGNAKQALAAADCERLDRYLELHGLPGAVVACS